MLGNLLDVRAVGAEDARGESRRVVPVHAASVDRQLEETHRRHHQSHDHQQVRTAATSTQCGVKVHFSLHLYLLVSGEQTCTAQTSSTQTLRRPPRHFCRTNEVGIKPPTTGPESSWAFIFKTHLEHQRVLRIVTWGLWLVAL